MGEPFVGEIRELCGASIPQGWALCDGQLLPIGAHETLFALFGDQFGGDGTSTFALPMLWGGTSNTRFIIAVDAPSGGSTPGEPLR